MFAVAVTFKINSAQVEAFMPLILNNSRSSTSEEPGCLQFDVLNDPDRPTEVFLYEVYADETAFIAHTKSAHYVVCQAAVEGMVESKEFRTFRHIQR